MHQVITHTADTDKGSSWAPFILVNTLKVICVHLGGDSQNQINFGIFIGEIFNEINNNFKKSIK